MNAAQDLNNLEKHVQDRWDKDMEDDPVGIIEGPQTSSTAETITHNLNLVLNLESS